MYERKMRQATLVLALALTTGLLSAGSAIAAPYAVPMAVNCTAVNNDFVATRANSIKV